MTAVESVDAYLDGKNADAVELFHRFEEIVESCGDVEAAPSKTVVFWKRERVFAGAHVDGRRLELVIDLPREAEHPYLLASFPTTKRAQLDHSIRALVQEAYNDVGPGTRRSA